MSAGSGRVKFVVAWALLLLAKVAIAARLDLFGDEAFYAWEAGHLDWAYSDLPGLTAWMAAVGTVLGGDSALALRAPFLIMGAALPWLVVRIARRWFGAEAGWQAGFLALLLPLAGTSGVLALPDVPLAFAALLAADAVAALHRRVGALAALQLALALCLGAFAHYRFAAVVLAGAVGLLLSQRGRRLLLEPWVIGAGALGALAWLPLLGWNLEHSGAGLAFHLVDRHPWQFQVEGALWPVVQALVVTPGLFALLLAVLAQAWRQRHSEGGEHWAWLLGAGGVAALGYFPLAFFADSERLSLHWPLPGWLLLVVAAPVVLVRWRPWARIVVFTGAGVGLAIALAYCTMAAYPPWRAQLAASSFYPDNFAGWREVAAVVREELATRPQALVVVDNFMLGAQLARILDLGDARLSVLEHPLNRKHGRAVQLQLWGLERAELRDRAPAATLLVVEDSSRPLKDRLAAHHQRCRVVGPLPPPRVLQVDHGRKRFLLYWLESEVAPGPCVAPAMAWIDVPAAKAEAAGRVRVSGWAFKDGAGLDRIELTLDGEVVATAVYGAAMPHVAEYWKLSTDSAHPHVGFSAELDLGGVEPGRHWLGLILHGRDGSVEPWPEQALQVTR